MKEVLLGLGYEYSEHGKGYHKKYNKCYVYIDINNHVILISTDGKGVNDIKRYSNKIEQLEKEEPGIIKSILYSKIKYYLGEGEEL